MEDAMDVLRHLCDAQDSLLFAMFDIDDRSKLEDALTLIGDVMNGISAEYGLPIMSEQ